MTLSAPADAAFFAATSVMRATNQQIMWLEMITHLPTWIGRPLVHTLYATRHARSTPPVIIRKRVRYPKNGTIAPWNIARAAQSWARQATHDPRWIRIITWVPGAKSSCPGLRFAHRGTPEDSLCPGHPIRTDHSAGPFSTGDFNNRLRRNFLCRAKRSRR